MEESILVIHMDRIEAINVREWTASATTPWDPETVIDDEDVQQVMYTVYIWFDWWLSEYDRCKSN